MLMQGHSRPFSKKPGDSAHFIVVSKVMRWEYKEKVSKDPDATELKSHWPTSILGRHVPGENAKLTVYTNHM